MRNTRTLLMAATIAVFGAVGMSSCGTTEPAKTPEVHEHGEGEAHDEHLHAATYQCPMQCEGDKTYTEPGKCPQCGMALEEVKDEHDHGSHEGHDHGDHEGHDH